MSFEPIVFGRTIPPTVPMPEPSDSATTAAATTPSTSSALALRDQLEDLVAASEYLQDVIHALNPGLGVTVDAESNPDLARALSQVYGGKVPPAISLKMYDANLDAELGSGMVNQGLGLDSTLEANPFQFQAHLTINKAVEAELVGGGFGAQSALLLRGLKTDALIHSMISSQLLDYPITKPASNNTSVSVTLIPASVLDIGQDQAILLQEHINELGGVYSSMCQVLGGVDAVAADVIGAVRMLTTVAIPDLVRIKALIDMTRGMQMQKSLKGLSQGLTGFVYGMLVTEASSLMFTMDRVIQMAVEPVSKMANRVGTSLGLISGAVNSTGELVGVVRSMKRARTVAVNGGLSGMPLSNSALTDLAMSKPAPPAFTALPLSKIENEIGSLMHFCNHATEKANRVYQDSFRRLTARLRKQAGSMTEMLSTLASSASLVSLVDAIIREQQNGAAAAQSAGTQLESVSRILASSRTGNGTNYTVQGGSISITPPQVPTPSSGAARVFAKSGIETSLRGLTQNFF